MVKERSDFERAIDEAFNAEGAGFLNLKVEMTERRTPPRAANCTENKYRFIRYIEKTENIQIIRPLGVSLK